MLCHVTYVTALNKDSIGVVKPASSMILYRWQITIGALGWEETFFLFKVSDCLNFLVKLSSALTIR